MSTEQNTSRPTLGLPPRRAAAQNTDAPLARMLSGRRQEAPAKKEEPKESPTENMTVSIPTALRNRAKAAYKATSYAEGDNTWAHFVAKAIEAETRRREAEHNQGEMYPAWGEKLPGGRRLKDS
jgi:Centromere-binding protein ParB C-terminal